MGSYAGGARFINIAKATKADFNCADHLVRKFERIGCNDTEGCRGFFCKCSMRLPQDTFDVRRGRNHCWWAFEEDA